MEKPERSKKKVRSTKLGRPVKFTDEQIVSFVIPKYLELVRQGFPDKAIAGELDVAVDYFIELEKRSVTFSEARKKAQGLREAFFYKMALAAMQGQVADFNPTIYIWLTRNILKWRNDDPHVVVEAEQGTNIVFRSSLDSDV